MAELGLRYRPSGQADLEEHAAGLALLARDLADVPPEILREAIDRHVRDSHFMPKASELITEAQRILNAQGAGRPVDMAERANARLRGEGNFSLRWFYDEQGQIQLERVG